MAEQERGYRAGFVTLVGRPNVGKSTLINALLGQQVAAVSPRPQTTRQRQLGILTTDEYQIVFIDTPGIHKPRHALGEYMNQVALDTLADADVIVWMVDGSVQPTEEDENAASRINALQKSPPVILVVNKVDALKSEEIPPRLSAYSSLAPQAEVLPVSAATSFQQDVLLNLIVEKLPAGSQFYDPEQITDLYERDIAADLIRAAALVHLRDEVPHSIAIRIDEYTEREETGAYIQATIFVEREGHKGIVIGKGGEMIKKIGSTARQQIEAMSGRKVFLELRVKVSDNWRSSPEALRSFGYTMDNK